MLLLKWKILVDNFGKVFCLYSGFRLFGLCWIFLQSYWWPPCCHFWGTFPVSIFLTSRQHLHSRPLGTLLWLLFHMLPWCPTVWLFQSVCIRAFFLLQLCTFSWAFDSVCWPFSLSTPTLSLGWHVCTLPTSVLMTTKCVFILDLSPGLQSQGSTCLLTPQLNTWNSALTASKPASVWARHPEGSALTSTALPLSTSEYSNPIISYIWGGLKSILHTASLCLPGSGPQQIQVW